MGDYHDQDRREEPAACQHFVVDSDFLRGRQHVFNFASTNFAPSCQKKSYNMFLKFHIVQQIFLWLLDLFFAT